MSTHDKTYDPFVSSFDPCIPIKSKTYSTPPHLYMGYQPANLAQLAPAEALKAGTLWKAFCDPYFNPLEHLKGGKGT